MRSKSRQREEQLIMSWEENNSIPKKEQFDRARQKDISKQFILILSKNIQKSITLFIPGTNVGIFTIQVDSNPSCP